MLDAIGTLVDLTCWIIFLIMPLGGLLYLLLTTTEKYDEGPPMDYMLEEKEEDVS